jgi:hypothetical protein
MTHCYDYVLPYSDSLALFKKGNKRGFIDKKNKIVIPHSKNEYRSFKNGVCAFKFKGCWGFIDKYNEIIIKPIYRDVWDFQEGFAGVRKGCKMGFIDKEGNEYGFTHKYDYVDDFVSGLARVKKSGKMGFVNQAFEEVIPCIYDSILNFSDGLAAVCIDNKWGFINRLNKITIECQYDFTALNFTEGLCGVVKNNKMGFIDISGRLVIDYQFDHNLIINECHVAFVNNSCPVKCSKTDKQTYINKNGNIISNYFDVVYSISDERGLVIENNKYGFVNSEGQIVIDLKYDFAMSFKDGISIVTIKDKSYE